MVLWFPAEHRNSKEEDALEGGFKERWTEVEEAEGMRLAGGSGNAERGE